MLADDAEGFHPWVINGMFDVMNDNQTDGINYYLDSYHYEVTIDVTKMIEIQ